MTIVFASKFLKSSEGLPLNIQTKLDQLIEVLSKDPYHPLLHTKQLTGNMTGYLSFRITRDWRVLFQFLDPKTIQVLRVKHRKDIYRNP